MFLGAGNRGQLRVETPGAAGSPDYEGRVSGALSPSRPDPTSQLPQHIHPEPGSWSLEARLPWRHHRPDTSPLGTQGFLPPRMGRERVNGS